MKTQGDDDETPLLHHLETPLKAATWRQYILDVTMFLYLSAYVMGDYVSYQYIYEYSSNMLHFNITKNSSCNVDKESSLYQLQQQVASMSSSWQLYFALASGIPSLISGMVYGTYSDRIGRKFMMVISIVSVCIRLTAYVVVIELNLSLYYVLPGYILEGVGGSYTLMYLACSAYTADVSHSGHKRSIRMMLMFTAAGLSDGVGFVSYGYSIRSLRYRNSFLVSMGIFVVSTVGVFCLPESRYGKHMQTMTFSRNISRVWRFYTEKGVKRYVYILCSLSLTFALLSLTQKNGIELMYLLDSPFCWSSIHVGNFQAIAKTIQRLVCFASMVIMLQCTSEEMTVIIFGIILVACMAVEAFAKSDVMMYVVAVLSFPSTAFIIIQRSIVSSQTDEDDQGALFASIQIIESVTNTVGTVLANLVYGQTVDMMRGAVFLYMAGLSAISTFIIGVLLLMGRQRRQEIMVN